MPLEHGLGSQLTSALTGLCSGGVLHLILWVATSPVCKMVPYGIRLNWKVVNSSGHDMMPGLTWGPPGSPQTLSAGTEDLLGNKDYLRLSLLSVQGSEAIAK